MCHHNDAYYENLSRLNSFVETLDLSANSVIADIGAGTGNFICELSKTLPATNFVHVDSNREMNSIAMRKYDDLEIQNVQLIENDVQRIDFPKGKFDLVICINALYAMNPQELILEKLRLWLI